LVPLPPHQPNIAISSLKGAMLRPNCLKIGLAGSRHETEQAKKARPAKPDALYSRLSSGDALTSNI
jgi:hypothetical protein